LFEGMMTVAIHRSLQFGLGIGVAEVAEAVDSRFAYPGKIVRDFAAVDPMGFVDSRSSVAAAVVAEGPVAEHILETLVVKMGCRSLTDRSALHRMFAGSGAERAVVAAGKRE
jgi:hypothetical protein